MSTVSKVRFKVKAIEDHEFTTGERARVTKALLFPASKLTVPPIAFGDTTPPEAGIPDEQVRMQWDASCSDVREVSVFWIEDAIVHPPFGIVTIGQYVISDSLAHVPFHLPGYTRDSDEISFPASGELIEMPAAIRVAGSHYTNYYHFLLDILVRLQVLPFGPLVSGGTILLPPIETAFQCDIMTLFRNCPNPLFILGNNHAVQVESLTFVPDLGGYEPNPHLRYFFRRIRSMLAIVPSEPNRRIYVTRRDSKSRIMDNEHDVELMVGQFGFDVVELSGMSFREQVCIFSSASHVIAAHGAGLANLVFCNDGARVCELLMSDYVNPLFRRLATVQNLQYSCLIGSSDRSSGSWVHNIHWNAPLDRLQAMLPRFAPLGST